MVVVNGAEYAQLLALLNQCAELNADASFAKGDYEGAQGFYTTALQKYTELEDQAQIDALSVKLDA